MEFYLIKETKGEYLFWFVPYINRTYARVMKGKLGEVAKKHLIQTDILGSVDSLIKKQKDNLLNQGFTEIKKEKLLILDVIVSDEFPDDWDEETMPLKLRLEVCELNEYINEYLFERGLAYIWSYLEFEDNILLMRFFTVNKQMTAKLIQENFQEQIVKLGRKMKKNEPNNA